VVAKPQRLDALRLSEVDQFFILQELEKAARQPANAERRASRRYRYQVRQGLVMQVPGLRFQFIVRPRNLSAGGISVLHGGFLYAGTACAVTLRTVDGEQLPVAGRIIRCRCVHGRAHELNIHFTEPIALERFVDLHQARVVAPAEPAYSRAQVVRLVRRLGELADEQAPLEQLSRVVAQLTALLNRH
jgi:hypothetical protein